MILEEFDPTKRAVINPDMLFKPIPGFPETVVSVFSWHLFERMNQFLGGIEIALHDDVDGSWPIFRVIYKDTPVAFMKARLGAPACVGSFEDGLPLGAKRIILSGNCGVLDKSIEDCESSFRGLRSAMKGPVIIISPLRTKSQSTINTQKSSKNYANFSTIHTPKVRHGPLMLFIGKHRIRSQNEKHREPSAWKWNAPPYRLCAISEESSSFNIFMQEITWIIPIGSPEVCTEMSVWTIKRKSHFWHLNLQQR